jgi:predicted ester cyclase
MTAADHQQAHAQHVASQVGGTSAPTAAARAAAVDTTMQDYASTAVVDDPLFGQPLVGKAAIAAHKTAEMGAVSNVSLNVRHSFVFGDQLIAEWEMTATHDGPFLGFAPTGNQITQRGATAMTRDANGKIVRESLFYDAADMQRQLSGASRP